MTDREIVIMQKMFLISLFDNAKLKAKEKDRITEMLEVLTGYIEANNNTK